MSEKLSLLVVDDDKVLREIIASRFEGDGYKVLQAANGRLAFDLALTNSVNAVVSDVRMPGGDGIELLKRLKSLSSESPNVILITGFTDLEVEEVYEFGAEAIFSKPFELRAIEATILNLSKPKNILWSQVIATPSQKISLKLTSVHEATSERKFGLGRGGMYLTLPRLPLRLGESIGFDLAFSDDPILSHLKGIGIVRWIREIESRKGEVALGVEFQYIDSDGMDSLLALIGLLKMQPFIPKGPNGEEGAHA